MLGDIGDNHFGGNGNVEMHPMRKLALSFLFFFAVNCLAAFPTGWGYNFTITIDRTKIPNTDQTNFPALIADANIISTAWAHINADGSDLFFSSGSSGATPLNRDLVSIDTAGQHIQCWVRIPTASHTADTVIYGWCGNAGSGAYPAATDATYGSQGVWDTNFNNVYHCESTAYPDSTSNAHTGTNHSTSAAAAKIGSGISNATGYVDCGDSTIGSGTNFTVEFWEYPTDVSTFVYFPVNLWKGALSIDYYAIGSGGTFSVTEPAFYFTNYNGIGGTDVVKFGPTVAINTWYHVTVVKTASKTYDFYINGSVVISSATVSNDFPVNTVWLGNREDSAWPFVGKIDEMRLSKTNRSADWIATCYACQNSPSTFSTPGTLTPIVAAAPLVQADEEGMCK